MTFYHFVNCIALSYAPFHMTYKVSATSSGYYIPPSITFNDKVM